MDESLFVFMCTGGCGSIMITKKVAMPEKGSVLISGESILSVGFRVFYLILICLGVFVYKMGIIV